MQMGFGMNMANGMYLNICDTCLKRNRDYMPCKFKI